MMEFSSLWYLLFWDIVSQLALAAICCCLAPLEPEYEFFTFSILFLLSTSICHSSAYSFLVRPPLARLARQPNPPGIIHPTKLVFWVLALPPVILTVYVIFDAVWFHLLDPLYNSTDNLGFFISSTLSIAMQLFLCISTSFYIVRLVCQRYRKAVREMENSNDFLVLVLGPLRLYSSHTTIWGVVTASYFVIVVTIINPRLPSGDRFMFDSVTFAVGVSISGVSLLMHDLRSSNKSLLIIGKIFRHRKLIQYPLIIVGIIVANQFLEEKSVRFLWVLIFLAIFWLGNLALRQPSSEVGVLGFIIGMVLECAMGVLGRGVVVLLVGVGCVGFLILHGIVLGCVRLRYPQVEESDWQKWQMFEKHLGWGLKHLEM